MAKAQKRKQELMRVTEAAALLGVSRSTVMYRIGRGIYRSETVAGLTLVARKDVEKAVAQLKTAA
jgi:excisionase family DNA binding protein